MAGVDFLGIVFIMFLTFVVVAAMIPKLLELIAQAISLTSGESVARQLSGLITISGAAPYKIQINHTIERVKYDVDIKVRTIIVKPKYNVPYAEKSHGIEPFAIPLPDESYKDVNSFTINKEFLEGESKYEFEAK
ncbi:MAG: hypothetical protein QXL86_02200 [Candidatus Aenigmatarchaeota archaeon]